MMLIGKDGFDHVVFDILGGCTSGCGGSGSANAQASASANAGAGAGGYGGYGGHGGHGGHGPGVEYVLLTKQVYIL